MNDDMALLREFAGSNSEEAFAVLVSRHVNLVYSVALRQVRDPLMAEEITQAVFIILARKAKSLGPKTILPGWLCRTARYVSANALTMRRRRQRREQEAYMQSTLNEPEPDAWLQIVPLLDDALARLGQKDHDALVLRFFENKSLGEVGLAIGTSEDTARMRVNRALEKLRTIFAKRGVSSTTATIAETISTNSVQAAPVALAKSVTAVALAKGAAASVSTLTLIKGALTIMTWTTAKTAAVAVVAAVLVVGTTTVVVKTIHPSVGKFTVDNLDAKIARLSHPGATEKEVLQELGEPTKYIWGNKTFNKDNLPNTPYILAYPQGVEVVVSGGLVQELRSEEQGRGFIWQGKLHLGSTLDEVLQALGPPSETVVGKPLGFDAGVLYKDIDGKKGYCYYARPDQNIRCFFQNNNVMALYVTLGTGNR
jgi:RNA polymerase sigma factor (sigma-70 family)